MAKQDDAIESPSDIEAYRVGVAACRDGIGNNSNPYRDGPRRVSWYTGWYEAKHERKFGWPMRWQ